MRAAGRSIVGRRGDAHSRGKGGTQVGRRSRTTARALKSDEDIDSLAAALRDEAEKKKAKRLQRDKPWAVKNSSKGNRKKNSQPGRKAAVGQERGVKSAPGASRAGFLPNSAPPSTPSLFGPGPAEPSASGSASFCFVFLFVLRFILFCLCCHNLTSRRPFAV